MSRIHDISPELGVRLQGFPGFPQDQGCLSLSGKCISTLGEGYLPCLTLGLGKWDSASPPLLPYTPGVGRGGCAAVLYAGGGEGGIRRGSIRRSWYVKASKPRTREERVPGFHGNAEMHFETVISSPFAISASRRAARKCKKTHFFRRKSVSVCSFEKPVVLKKSKRTHFWT